MSFRIEPGIFGCMAIAAFCCLGRLATGEEIVPAKDLGVEFEILLDEPTLRFPDPVYAFVRIRNVSGQPAVMAEFGIDRPARVGVEFGEIQWIEESEVEGTDPPLRKQLADAVSALPVLVPYASPRLANVAAYGETFDVVARAAVRPREVSPALLNHLVPGESGDGPTLPYLADDLDPGNEMLAVETQVKLQVDPDATIFKADRSFLSQMIRVPTAWRTQEDVRELVAALCCPDDCNPPFCRDATPFPAYVIERLPVLWPAPEMYFSIEEHLRRDTASYRYIQLTKVDRWYAENCTSIEDVDTLQAEVLRVLTDCGPAEFAYWEKRITHVFAKFWPAAEVTADEAAFAEQQFARWCGRIEAAFPDMPLAAAMAARRYDVQRWRENVGEIDVERLRQTLEEIRATRQATKAPTHEDGYLLLPDDR